MREDPEHDLRLREVTADPSGAVASSRSVMGPVLNRLPRGLASGTLGPLVALAVLVVVLSLNSSVFLTGRNLGAVLDQVSGLAIVAVGATLVIIVGGIDLSPAAVMALAGVSTGWLFVDGGWPLYAALLGGLVIGAAAGAVNGALITLAGLPPFVATLAMLSAARGLALLVSDGQTISGFPTWFTDIVSKSLIGPFTLAHVIMAVVLLGGGAYLRYRPGGRALYAVGGGEEVARLAGINVTATKFRVYVVAGVLASVGGLLLLSRLNSASPIAAEGFELDIIAAVVIGGASLSGGRGSILGTFLGALIIVVLRNGLTLLDVASYIQQVIIGVVIALAVMTDTLNRRKR